MVAFSEYECMIKCSDEDTNFCREPSCSNSHCCK